MLLRIAGRRISDPRSYRPGDCGKDGPDCAKPDVHLTERNERQRTE